MGTESLIFRRISKHSGLSVVYFPPPVLRERMQLVVQRFHKL